MLDGGEDVVAVDSAAAGGGHAINLHCSLFYLPGIETQEIKQSSEKM
jgi:hypothetical protein